MDIFYILLRVIHIFSGIFWAGGAVTFALFVSPSVAATLPESQKFMAYFVQQRHFLDSVVGASLTTVLAGILLYYRDTSGLQGNVVFSLWGLSFTIGALVGISAFLVLLFMVRPLTAQFFALGKEIQMAGKPPTPEQVGKMQAIRARLTSLGLLGVGLLAVTVLGMVLARPLGFG